MALPLSLTIILLTTLVTLAIVINAHLTRRHRERMLAGYREIAQQRVDLHHLGIPTPEIDVLTYVPDPDQLVAAEPALPPITPEPEPKPGSNLPRVTARSGA